MHARTSAAALLAALVLSSCALLDGRPESSHGSHHVNVIVSAWTESVSDPVVIVPDDQLRAADKEDDSTLPQSWSDCDTQTGPTADALAHIQPLTYSPEHLRSMDPQKAAEIFAAASEQCAIDTAALYSAGCNSPPEPLILTEKPSYNDLYPLTERAIRPTSKFLPSPAMRLYRSTAESCMLEAIQSAARDLGVSHSFPEKLSRPHIIAAWQHICGLTYALADEPQPDYSSQIVYDMLSNLASTVPYQALITSFESHSVPCDTVAVIPTATVPSS